MINNTQVTQGDKSVYVEGNANIVYNANEPIPQILNSPPFIPEVFIGRENSLQQLHDSLFSEENLLLLVNGNGGIGKTTLAAQYYYKYQEKYLHLGWLYAQDNLADAIISLATVLKVRFDESQEEMSVEKKVQLILFKIVQLGKPCLLILDNINDVDELDKYYPDLRKCVNFHLILTTRISEFKKAKSLLVNGLNKNFAKDLFVSYYSIHDKSEDDLLDNILEAIGYNTLVVELLAKNMSVLNEFNTNYKLQELHADIKSRGLLNLPNSREVEIYYQDQSNIEKPEKIIAAMYDLSELSDSSKKVLSIFSILPSEQISYTNLKALVKAFKEDLESSLSYLYKRGWIDYNKSTYSFKCNPIIQEITKDFNKNRIKEDVRDVVKFLIEVLAESEKKSFNYSEFQSLQKNVRYAENIIKLNFAEHEDFIHLAQELGDFYSYYSNISKSKFYYNQSLKKAIFFFENSNSSNSLLGDLYQSLGEIGDAIECYKKDITYIHSTSFHKSDSDRNKELVVIYAKLSKLFASINIQERNQYLRDFDETVNKLGDSRFEELSFIKDLALSYESIGEAIEHDNPMASISFYKKYYDLSCDLVTRDQNNLFFKYIKSIACSKLGHYYLHVDQNLDKAVKYNEESYKLIVASRDENPFNTRYLEHLSTSLEKLGGLYVKLNETEKAIVFFEQEEAIQNELLISDPENQKSQIFLSIVYEKLGDAYQKIRNTKKALHYYKLLLEITLKYYETNKFSDDFIKDIVLAYSRLTNFYFENNTIEESRLHNKEFEKLLLEIISKKPYIDFYYWLAVCRFQMLKFEVVINEDYSNKLNELEQIIIWLKQKAPNSQQILSLFKEFKKLKP